MAPIRSIQGRTPRTLPGRDGWVSSCWLLRSVLRAVLRKAWASLQEHQATVHRCPERLQLSTDIDPLRHRPDDLGFRCIKGMIIGTATCPSIVVGLACNVVSAALQAHIVRGCWHFWGAKPATFGMRQVSSLAGSSAGQDRWISNSMLISMSSCSFNNGTAFQTIPTSRRSIDPASAT